MFRHCLLIKRAYHDMKFYRFNSTNMFCHTKQAESLVEQNQQCLQVVDDYLTTNEYEHFLKEIDQQMKRKRYEYSHWDDVECCLILIPVE